MVGLKLQNTSNFISTQLKYDLSIFPFNKILSLPHNKNLCVQRSQNFGEILDNPFKYCIFATAVITSIEVPKVELIQNGQNSITC